METKANHTLIGGFVLLLVAAIFGFLIWLARINVNKEFDHYTIYYREAVAGLGVGGDVRFNGIKVGSVTDIDFDHEDPSQVKVTVQVSGGTPINSDAFATLQPQGLTGLSYVQITGRKSSAEMLHPTRRQPYPVIPSRPSTLGQLAEQAPEVLSKGIHLLDRASEIMNAENQRAVANILADIAILTGEFAKTAPEITRIVKNADVVTSEMRKFSERLGPLGEALERTSKTELPATLTQAKQAAASIGKAADQMQKLLAENETAVSDFTGEGLAQFGRFLTESRLLVQTLQRLAERIENDPAQFLFGGRAPERKAE